MPDLKIVPADPSERGFGDAALGRDLDRDGISDLLIGSWHSSAVHLVQGGPHLPHSGRFDQLSATASEPDVPGFGFSLAVGFDGETPELFVGATDGNRAGSTTTGSVLALDASLDPTRTFTPPTGHMGDGFGYSLAALDLQARGQFDLVLGARYLESAPGAMDRTGQFYIYRGASAPPIIITSAVVGAELGVRVARETP